MKKLKIGVSDLVLFVLSLVLPIGAATFFSACGPMKDGKWMACHWAEQTVLYTGIVISVIALAGLVIPDRKIKAGLSLAVIPVSVLAALIPGVIISLCMMPEMQCRAVMRPAVIFVSSLIAVVALVNAIVQIKKSGKES